MGRLPGEEGVGIGAVEVPELLDLADELPQCGHLPHLPAAAGLLRNEGEGNGALAWGGGGGLCSVY
jgi:hypothetical protein